MSELISGIQPGKTIHHNDLPGNYERDLEIVRKVAEGMTYKSVGLDYDLTRERVRQIYKKFVMRNGFGKGCASTRGAVLEFLG